MTVSLRRKNTALSSPRWQRLVIICVSMLVISLANIGFTIHVDNKRESQEREADRRWCLLLSTLDRAYAATPPTTELGREVARAIHSLRLDLGCR